MTEILQVDVSNPGQVFACLGLLEILDLLSPGSEGAFPSDTTFKVESGAHAATALSSVAEATVEEERLAPTPPPWGVDKAWPVTLEGDFGLLVLDPWLEPDHSETSKGLKLWAGRVGTLDLVRGLAGLIPRETPLAVPDAFDWESPGTPTGLDPRSAVSKEDLGYSYNSQGLKPQIYPIVDTFALIGLRAARPPRTGSRTYAYHLWDTPIPPILARAALKGELPSLMTSRWIYTVESRGLNGTYKYLSRATLEESVS